MSQVHLAGIFGNIILLLLAIYGAVLIRYQSTAEIVMIFASLAILPVFFGDKVILNRVLFDIPFQLPVGFAMTNIFLSREGKFKIIAVILSLLASVIYTMHRSGKTLNRQITSE